MLVFLMSQCTCGTLVKSGFESRPGNRVMLSISCLSREILGSYLTVACQRLLGIFLSITNHHSNLPCYLPIDMKSTKVTWYFNESSVLWNILPCSSLKVSRRFREVCRLHLQAHLAACFTLVSCLLSTLKMEALFSCEMSVHPMNGLHSIISQKTGFFITTAVRTSDPTCNDNIYRNCHMT
jgi:hypothetical protein